MVKAKRHKFSNRVILALIVITLLVIDLVLLRQYVQNRKQLAGPDLTASLKIPVDTGLLFPSPTPVPAWTMLLTGDVIPARDVNAEMVKKNDFLWPVRGIKEVMKNADLTLINLEAPLLKHCSIVREGFQFCGDNRFVGALTASGVDIVNLANNHTLNFGWEGLGETEEVLNGAGIETVGFTAQDCFSSSESDVTSDESRSNLKESSRLRSNNNLYCSKFVIKEVRGIKIGFLGYNGVGQTIDRDIAREQIEMVDKLVDVLVVSVHWGKEYEREPVAGPGIAPDNPNDLGKLFIDWGADVVAGNHPHWYQPLEWYMDKPIFYALGNTVFDQEWSPETKQGILARLHFSDTDIMKDQTEIFPIGIRNFGEAYLLEGEEKEEILHFYATNL